MILQRQTSAFVTLAAAYAVVLQAVLLTICGAMAEGQALGAATLCAASQGDERHPAPAGHGDECLSACLACGCGIAAAPMRGAERVDLRGPVQRITTRAIPAGAALLRIDHAHRPRGPPHV